MPPSKTRKSAPGDRDAGGRFAHSKASKLNSLPIEVVKLMIGETANDEGWVKNHGLQISPGPPGLCSVSENDDRLLPGVSGEL